jgi:hypothetical protein
VNNVVISRSCRRCNDAIEMRSTICESLAGKRQAPHGDLDRGARPNSIR